jgi:hypothetical protein
MRRRRRKAREAAVKINQEVKKMTTDLQEKVKAWWQSKTLIGIALAMVVVWLDQLGLTPADVAGILDKWSTAIVSLSLSFAAISRVLADKKLE